MSSQAEEKRRRRSEREAAERADVARSARRRRLGAVTAVAVVVVAVAVALSRSSSDEPRGQAAGGDRVVGVDDMTALLQGIPQDGTVLGNPEARVTLVEYADLQCTFCRQYAVDVLPTLIERYVRPGRVKLDLRLLRILGPDSDRAARAALAAAERDRFWQFAELFFRNQGPEGSGYPTDEFLTEIGSAVPGLDGKRLVTRSGAQAIEERIARFEQDAAAADIQGTPSFQLVQGKDDPEQLIPETLDSAAFTIAIDRALSAAAR